MLEHVNRHPNSNEVKKFALILLIGMPTAGAIWTGIIWWSQDILNLWILAIFSMIGLIACGLSIASKSAGRAIYIGWHILAALVELVISFVSTLIMYSLTIVPIGLIMKLFGRKPLSLSIDRDAKTYWRDCKETKDLKRYFRQY